MSTERKEVPFNTEAVRRIARKTVAKTSEFKIAEVEGLYLTVHPSGTASFTHRYQTGNGASRTQRRSTLGRHGVMTLAEAKSASIELLRSINKGEDPVGTKRAKSRTMTIADLFEQRCKTGKKLKPSTMALYRLELNAHAPKLLKRPIAEVTKRELARELARIEADASPFVAHQVRAALGTSFKHAVKRDLLDDNPTLGLGFTVNAKDTARERRFTEEELRSLWSAFNGEPLLNDSALADGYAVHLSTGMKRILQVMMLTGQRESNVCGAATVELEGLDTERPIWRIPGSRMKKGREQVVALSAMATAVFKEAIAEAGKGSVYVFPADVGRSKGGRNSSKPKTPHVRRDSVSTAMDRMRKKLKPESLSDARAHDLRRALATWLAENEAASFEVRQVILAHQRTDTLGQHYEFATFERPMRAALNAWASWLTGEAAVATNVVRLKA